jgi:hypothetical protein
VLPEPANSEPDKSRACKVHWTTDVISKKIQLFIEPIARTTNPKYIYNLSPISSQKIIKHLL